MFTLSVSDINNKKGGLGDYYSIIVDVEVVACNRKWEAKGKALIDDYWDFNYEIGDVWDEVKDLWDNSARDTRTMAGSFIYGTPFQVRSVDLSIKQSSNDFEIVWE